MLRLMLERGYVCAFADELKYVSIIFFSSKSSPVAAGEKSSSLEKKIRDRIGRIV